MLDWSIWKEAGSPAGLLAGLDEESLNEFRAALILRHTQGIGSLTYKTLLDIFHSAYNAVCEVRQWKNIRIARQRIIAVQSNAWQKDALEEWELCRQCDGHILLWTDEKYPALLRELPNPPLFLYYRGEIDLLHAPCLGIVGKRNCSPAGAQATREISRDISAAGMTVVSGMAIGIDRAAHLAAVNQSGSTIAVLGAGLDVDYPGQNRDLRRRIAQNGLMITEFAPKIPPYFKNFPFRNRLISGLSLGVLVTEADLRSGSLITARLALEQNRSVYVLTCFAKMTWPEPPDWAEQISAEVSEGCQNLLVQGAIGIRNAEDILRDLNPQLRAFQATSSRESKRKASYEENIPDVAFEQQASLEKPFDLNKNNFSQKEHKASTKPSASTNETKKKSSTIPSNVPKQKNTEPVAFPDSQIEASSLSSSPEDRILASLEKKNATIDDLCQDLALSPDEVSAVLIMLEVQGQIRRLKDLSYTIV